MAALGRNGLSVEVKTGFPTAEGGLKLRRERKDK